MNYTDKDVQAIVDTQVELKTKDLKQALNEIREMIKKRATDENGDIGINLFASECYDILQIIEKVLGENHN